MGIPRILFTLSLMLSAVVLTSANSVRVIPELKCGAPGFHTDAWCIEFHDDKGYVDPNADFNKNTNGIECMAADSQHRGITTCRIPTNNNIRADCTNDANKYVLVSFVGDSAAVTYYNGGIGWYWESQGGPGGQQSTQQTSDNLQLLCV